MRFLGSIVFASFLALIQTTASETPTSTATSDNRGNQQETAPVPNHPDDTVAFQGLISNAVANAAILDLKGATFRIGGLSIDKPLTIKNGTLIANATLTNTAALVNVAASGVTFDHINIDGGNRVLRGLRIVAGARGFRWVGGLIANMFQPPNDPQQGSGVRIEGNTEFAFSRGWMISNVVASPNGIIGDDQGCARGILIVPSGNEAPPTGIIEDGVIAAIRPFEDGDGIGIHQWNGASIPVKIRRIRFDGASKRAVKIMGDGIEVEDLTINAPNDSMHAGVSVYASGAHLSRVIVPISRCFYGIEVGPNGRAISNIVVEGCRIGTGSARIENESSEGIRVGGPEGVRNVEIKSNVITNVLYGIAIHGAATNYSVVGNTVHGVRAAILDGDIFVVDKTYATNQFGVFKGNSAFSPQGYGLRLKRSHNATVERNTLNARTPQIFDAGDRETLLPSTIPVVEKSNRR